MDYELTDEEKERMRRLGVLREVATRIALRWVWLFAACFALATAVFAAVLVRHTAKSGHRFESVTRLLYTPRQVAKIENMSDRQLLSILDRKSLKRKVSEKLELGRLERECLTIDLSVVQERKPTNLFTLRASAPTKQGAAAKADAYAETLIEEYVAYRRHDLAAWRDSIAVRRRGLQEQIARLESEESTLKGRTGIVAPVEALTMVNSLLSDQRRNLAEISVDIANEEAKKKRLESVVGGVGPLVSQHAREIRRRSAEIAEMDAAIAALLVKYTEKNPKVVGKLEERKQLLDAYTAFLEEKGISGVDAAEVDKIAGSAEELAETSMRLDALRESRAAVEREIAGNEKKSEELTAAIPAVERLRVRRADVEQTARALDEQLDDIAYLDTTAANDLRQIERAGSAAGKNPLRPVNFAMAAAAAGCGTGALAFFVLALEFAFGKMRDGKELAARTGAEFLGSLPSPGSMDEEEEKEVTGVVALRAANSEVPKGTVLVCRLPGAEVPPGFRESLEWTLAMAGHPTSAMDIDVGGDAGTSDDPLGTVRMGGRETFPVGNHYVLAPSELEMLKAGVAERHKENDTVFVVMPENFRRGGSFFDQLLTACDSVLLFAGAGTTPRDWLAWAAARLKASGKPVLAVATGVGAKAVRKELEAAK